MCESLNDSVKPPLVISTCRLCIVLIEGVKIAG